MAGELEFLIKARDEASDVMNQISDQWSKAAGFLEKNWLKVTAAAGVAGAGIEAMAQKQAPLTEQTRRLSEMLGTTEEEVRGMALEITGVTSPLEDVLDLMETGRQQGIDSAEALKEYAAFWSNVGDATGENGPALAEASAGLRAVGIAAGDEQEALASFGYVTQETTGNINEFLSFLERTGPELREMGLGVDESAAIMGALEHELGMTARTARMEFRQAVNESDGDMNVLLETLGLTEEQFSKYQDKVKESSDVIQRNADIHADSYTVMDKIKQKANELSYEYGGVFEMASNLTPALLVLGPAIKAVGVAKNVAAVAARGLGTAIKFMTGPIGLVITAIGALVAAGVWLYQNWDMVKEKAVEIWGAIKEFFSGLWEQIKEVFHSAWEWIKNMFLNYTPAGLIIKHWDKITGFFSGLWDGVKSAFQKAWDWIKNMFLNYTPQGLVIKHWDEIKDFFSGLWDNVVESFQSAWDWIQDIVSTAWETVSGFFYDKWNGLVDFFSGLWDTVSDGFSSAWNGMVDIVKGCVNTITGFINSMIGGVESGINAIIGAFNSIPSVTIPDWIPGLGGKELGLPEISKVSLPRIPEWDTGGLVQGPGVFAVGPGVKEIVRYPQQTSGVNIGSININASTREGGRQAAKGLIDEMHRRGIKLTGLYAY